MKVGSGDNAYWTDATDAGWLPQPVTLHSSRKSMCDLTPEQCAFKFQWGLNWYEADHQYELTAIAFVLAFIVLYAFEALGDLTASTSLRRTSMYRRVQSGVRFLAYRHFRIRMFEWYSPSLRVIFTGAADFAFFMNMSELFLADQHYWLLKGLTLGKRSYYWPNTAEVSYDDFMPIVTRTGWMSIALLSFVLVLGAKENPIIMLIRVAYEKLNVFHRWISWAMYVLALVHTFSFIIFNRNNGDMGEQWRTSVFYWSGTVALAAQSWMMFMSIGPIRNRFYEFFKVMHLLVAALFFIFLFIHCDFMLISWDYLISAIVLYIVCVDAPWLRTHFEYGPRSRRARIEALAHNTVKVSVRTTSSWAAKQHIFLRFLRWNVHSVTAHPFIIASLLSSHDCAESGEIGATSEIHAEHEMTFFIHPRKGFTGRLTALARQTPDRCVRVLLDGPYGGMKDRSLSAFERAVIVADGAGAEFTLPVIEEILRKRTSATRDVRVILATRSTAHMEWFRNVIAELMQKYETQRVQVEVHIISTGTSDSDSEVSKISDKRNETESSDKGHEVEVEVGIEKAPAQTKGTASSREQSDSGDKTIMIRRGRPDTAGIVRKATEELQDSVSIAVCEPESMLFDVRNAAAVTQSRVGKDGLREVYLYSECFGW